MKWIIYMTTDLETQKIYIGQHLVRSKGTLDNWYFGGSETIRAMSPHAGMERLTRDVLAECSNEEDADVLERFFIWAYDSMNPKIGYNRSSGGRLTHGDNFEWERRYKPSDWEKRRSIMREHLVSVGEKTRFQKGHKLSKESIEKRKAHLPKRRRPMSEETKRKIGKANKGRPSWAKGKKLGPLPPETRKKISKSHQGKRPLCLMKPVKNLSTGLVYESISSACRAEGVKSLSGLRRCLNGLSESWHGCQWCFVDKEK